MGGDRVDRLLIRRQKELKDLGYVMVFEASLWPLLKEAGEALDSRGIPWEGVGQLIWVPRDYQKEAKEVLEHSRSG